MNTKHNKKVTLNLIADAVNLSVSTVSRVLNGQASNHRIKKETEETVLRVAKELNYEPHYLARGLRLNKTDTIGLIIPDISNHFFSVIGRSIEIEARKNNYSIMLCDSQENTEVEINSIKLLKSKKVDGIIICPVGKEMEHLERLYKSKIPLVVIDRYSKELDCPHVVSDNYTGALEAINYLFDNGHRVIGCIQGIPNTSVNEERIRGFRDAYKKNDIQFDNNLIVGDSFGERNGYISTKLLLNREVRPTAIFAASNLILLGALRALSEGNIRIPEDISIIAFDDELYSKFLSPPITTVIQQKTEMGNLATKLLIDQIKSKDSIDNKGFVLPTNLIIRNSVKRLNYDS
ncbi:LacI family DNA-binding transcriptional regulator [bacterium]|nr:LacI family DNA-binding transcriptional regulator [bacterium]